MLCDRESVKQRSMGRATPLSDVVHPMLQYLAQGACVAVEDAVVPADQVTAAKGDFEGAFQAYERLAISVPDACR